MASNEDKWLNLPNFCSCTHSKDNVYEYLELKEMLPVDYNYTVCNWFRENERYFECRLRVNVSTKDGALSWLEAFKHSSNTYYTIDKTFPEDSQNLVYKVVMKCYRNTRPRSNVKKAHPQHTNCQARLAITVKRTEKSRKYRSTDIHLQDFPMVVLYRHKHNHDSNPVKALQKHSINPEVTDMFVKYFKEGFSPSKAIEQYIIHLKEKYGDEYHKALEDERLLPDKQSVYKLYYKAFSKEYHKSKRKQMFQSLESHVTKFNTEMKGKFSELKVFDDGNFVVVIVSPLMKRVLLNISETSDVLFMDSFDNADMYGSKVFAFLTKSCYGALPVCFVILSSYREDLLSYALDLFKTFLNDNCFERRGFLGPKVFMVEDNASVKSCISKAFPNAFVVLNTCLVLRDSWKYLVNANIPLRRLQELHFNIKEMFYCTSEEQLSLTYSKLKSSPLAAEFPNYISYVEKLFAKKEEWAKCFRYALVSTEEHIKNICEKTLDIIEDNIFPMKKLYYAVNIFDYIVFDVDQFYRNKLISLIDDQNLPNQAKKKTYFDVNNYRERQLLKYGEKSFKVRSLIGKRDYFVELDIGVCNCRNGKYGFDCEHQSFASMKYCDQNFTSLPIDLEAKAVLFYIATGQADILKSYLLNLCDTDDEENIERASEVIIVEPNASAILEFMEDEEENSNTESTSENLSSKQEDKIKTVKEFQKCVNIFANQGQNNSAMLDAKQFVNNFKKLKTENSFILPLNCCLNDTKKLDNHKTAIIQDTVSNNSESVVSSNISVKRYLTEGNSHDENFTSILKHNNKPRTSSPLIVRISQKM